MMKLKIIFLIAFLINFIFLSGQRRENIIYKEVEAAHKKNSVAAKTSAVQNLFTEISPNSSARKFVSHYKSFKLNKNVSKALAHDKSEILSIELKGLNNEPLILDLVDSYDIFSNTKITTSSGKNFSLNQIPGAFYRGVIRGDRESTVSLSIFNDEVYGIISNSTGNIVLGKVKGNEEYILYNDKNLSKKNSFMCSALDIPDYEKYLNLNNNSSRIPALNNCVRIYYEVTYNMYQNKGSVENVVQYMTGLHTQVSIIYLNEGIKTPLSEIMVWDTMDPYSEDRIIDNMLTKFGTIRDSFNGDLGQLITLGFGGGIAWMNALCRTPYYRKSVAGIFSSYQNFPTYSSSVTTMAHELGHNLGSPHTHDCKWNGNNTPIDGCYPPSGSCERGPMPLEGGTIMSYCDMNYYTPVVGINFNLGFGPQPGELIRNRVMNASCLQSCVEDTCPAVINIDQPITQSEDYQSGNLVNAFSQISDNLVVNLKSSQISLTPGFSTGTGNQSLFTASIDPCETKENFYKDIIQQNVEETNNIPSKNPYIEIYPNPNFGTFKISLNELNGKVSIQIYEITGSIIYNKSFNGKESTEIDIDIQQHPAGVYVVKVQAENQTTIKKIIKK